MKVSQLIEELYQVKEQHGDIEVTLTAALVKDGFSVKDREALPDVFESTCENLIIRDDPKGSLKKRVRLYF